MMDRNNAGKPTILVIGLGPGNGTEITPRALSALRSCDVVVGYSVYIDIVNDILPGLDTRPFPMKHEVERCRNALGIATSRPDGATVGIVSSGDPGVYGMAGVLLEVVHEAGTDVDVEIVPGITACCSAAARVGAPLTHDFAVISLSDLLTPWETIAKRLRLAAEADFVLCLYNPASRKRHDYLRRACEAIAPFKSPTTPCAWVRMAGRADESFQIIPFSELTDTEVDMFCTVLIGNSMTKAFGGRMVTPRGYNVTDRM